MPRMDSIGRRVRALRKARELNQTDLARALGVNQSTVSDIETDKTCDFSAGILIRMADVLLRSPYFIMTGIDDDVRGLTSEEAEVLRRFRDMDAPQQAALLTMARALGKPDLS